MKAWARRAAELRDELAQITDVKDPRWWLVAGGAAVDWTRNTTYLASDAEPWADTFIAHRDEVPRDVLADALVRAHAARAAMRELDGELPGQPLAVTVRRTAHGAVSEPSALDVVAFAIGKRVITHRLAARIEDETGQFVAADTIPFVTITLGDEPIETARHGHRRSWRDGHGPWLGLGRSRGLAVVSTCHLVVDGYGHAWLTARIAAHARRLRDSVRPMSAFIAPPPSTVAGAMALSVTWRELPSSSPRAVALAYALGIVLHEVAGARDATFSPTFQIPVAPGAMDDPHRLRNRVVPALASVRFDRGTPEPFATFAARTKQLVAREAAGHGVLSRLLGAARAAPVPLAWKRQAVGAERPSWLEPIANVLGGRGCMSRIKTVERVPPSFAVSSPAQLASETDDLGSCVVTVVDDGTQAAITWCGFGRAGDGALLDRLLARLPR
jgi:hypothetical protein